MSWHIHINELQTRALISIAHKAPFAKVMTRYWIHRFAVLGNRCIKLKFEGQDWPELMDSMLKNVQNNLGIEDHTIEAQIYKLLMNKGDFFLTHKDGEKEKVCSAP
ncbi:MAG: hypothetical protein IPJ13_25015 [Saprospiraceae bacterium]|nr:hypothetical protein [Saprospiraceae bacterium]